MGRSLFGKLHRRFGRRISGDERRQRAAEHYERLRQAMPVGLVDAPRRVASTSPRVAVLGAGFAGVSAAWFAKRAGFGVTLIEPLVVGGRVSSTHKLVPGRILEAGAELIGTNHPLWLALAAHFGLALSVVSSEDNYAAAGLAMPMIIDGRSLSNDEQKKLHAEMDGVFRQWGADSAVVKNPWSPWTTDDAAKLDAMPLAAQIPNTVSELAKKAILLEFELDNCTPPDEQSWLGALAQLAAGGGYAFFDETEVFRCAAGNQSLAQRLATGLDLNQGRAVNIKTGDRVFIELEGGATDGPFDYAVVAVPSVAMEKIKVDGRPFPYRAIAHGPAVKYLSGVERRFWIPEGVAPSGMSDQLGMIWEGTDNQMDTARFDVSVFAGGRPAQHAIEAGGGASYFAPRLNALLPHYEAFTTEFENWPKRIGMGYSTPAMGEVTTTQKSYTELIAGRIAVAGEHTSPAWFGFMEGALESGLMAMARIAASAGIELPPAYGNFKRS
ncbi:MAG: monoamine oxidase [Thermoanaerobaculia bacterium]|jgi:monoamine oxidase|nr:monoamine oxidase [Thermoanaerobaculia bacterium]